MKQAVILSAVRTAIGKFQGSLTPFSATALGAKAVAETVKRAGVEPEQVDEIIMGNVLSAGLGEEPARQGGAQVRGSGRPGHRHRQRRGSRGGRDGVNDQRPLPADAGARRLPAGPR